MVCTVARRSGNQTLLHGFNGLYPCSRGEMLMSATITLPLDTELASLLAKKAAVEGVNVEQFAINTLRRAAEMPTISELFAEVGAAFEASGRTDEELQHDIEQALAEVRAERRAKIDE
jgi:hypothetical protein